MNTRQGAAARRIQIEIDARRLLEIAHAVLGIEVALVMVLTGAPEFIEEWFSPWSRIFLALGAIIPAVLILVGSRSAESTPRGWTAALWGFVGLAGWYAFMGLAYAALALQNGIQFVTPGQVLEPGMSGRAYVPFIYQALMMAVSVHVWVLLRLGRPRR